MSSRFDLSKLNIEDIIESLEKDRFTILTAFIYFILIGVIRSVAESLIFEFPNFSLYMVIQHTAFNFPVFVIGVLVIKFVTDAPLRKIYNIVLIGMFLVVLPPFIDYLAFGYSGIEYSYLYRYYGEGLPVLDRIASISPYVIFTNERISPGLRMVLFSITSMSTFYIALKIRFQDIYKLFKQRSYRPIFKKISTLFFGGFSIWLVMVFINATVPILIQIEEEGVELFNRFLFRWEEKYFLFFEEYNYARWEIFPGEFGIGDEIGLAEALTLQQRSLFITMYFFIVTFSVLIITLWYFKPNIFQKIISKVKFQFVFVTTMMALLGTAVNHITDPDFTKGYALDPTYTLHVPYIFYIFIVGLFLGLLASFIWEYYRNEGDKYLNKQLIITSFLGGISFSLLLGELRTVGLFVLCSLFLWTTFRTDKDVLDIMRSGLFSISALFVFLYGFYSPSIWKVRRYEFSEGLPVSETYSTLNLTRTPEMTGTIVGILLVSIVMVLVCTYISKMILNENLEYPKTYLILPVFLLPLIYLNSLDYILVFSILGLVASTLVDKKKYYLPLYMISFQFLYIIITLTGILQF